MTTTRKLVRIGNSVALILDHALLDHLGVDANSEVELSTTGRVLVVSPKDVARAEAFRNSVQKIIDRYGVCSGDSANKKSLAVSFENGTASPIPRPRAAKDLVAVDRPALPA